MNYGETLIDGEQMFLREIKNRGTVVGVPELLPFIKRLWEPGTKYHDEKRLNRFLIRIGVALKSKSDHRGKSEKLDWRTILLVGAWCHPRLVEDEFWPPLCCLSPFALAKFLSLCRYPLWRPIVGTKLPSNPRTLEQEVRRLGLKRLPKGIFKNVEKKDGEFRYE